MANDDICFEWNPAKNRSNIAKHGIDFNDVPTMFGYPMLTLRDDRVFYGEQRWTAIGFLPPFHAVVVYVEKCEHTIRIISARKATRREVSLYEKTIKNRL